MFGKSWGTSERRFRVRVEYGVDIPLSDGVRLRADVFRPDTDEKVPALFGMSPYPLAPQTGPIRPGPLSTALSLQPGQEKASGYIEAGDPNFFARRGYAHVVANTRGTGDSGGSYEIFSPREGRDGAEAIEWIARQEWCDGKVGMFGASYFGIIQWLIAQLQPEPLTCIFAPWAMTDLYRDHVYHGGIFSHSFWRGWAYGSVDRGRAASWTTRQLGEDRYEEAVGERMSDPEIRDVPELLQVLRNPSFAMNPLLVDFMLNPDDGPFWEERRVNFSAINVPAYMGADWGNYGMHLPGAFRNWANTSSTKRMLIGPQAYLDRPLYQLQYESLRWFDQWLKGIDTALGDEPPIKLFVMGTGEWKEAAEWPLPETKWTPFYLHENGLLSEHELWPNEGSDSYDDSPWHRGFLEYTSPLMVENTEVIGPIVLNLFASSTDDDAFFFVSVREVDPNGNERILTRGWLRASHRALDPERSRPWLPFHTHLDPTPLTPNEIYEFQIAIVPTSNLFPVGSCIKVRISGADDPPRHALEMIATGHLSRAHPSRVTVYHDDDHPSSLVLPITKGNVLGTFISGGKPFI